MNLEIWFISRSLSQNLALLGLETSRDGLIRKVRIKYRNASENQDRTTIRRVRTIFKIWSEDDLNLENNLTE